MIDITELAQRLKLEVHRAVSDFNPQMNIKTRDLKELVEALEKAQQRIGKLEKKLTDHKRMNQEMAKAMLTPNDSDAAGMEIAALRQRIAELESRTVKLPEPFKLAKSSSGLTYYYADEVDAAITAAGIKVEAE
ncbi:hypothetical protein ACV1MZ_000049 [Klebsiella variicola]